MTAGECLISPNRRVHALIMHVIFYSSICLWSITKKKPIFTVQMAHGVNEYESESEGIIGNARWITALGCMPYGDTFASGVAMKVRRL